MFQTDQAPFKNLAGVVEEVLKYIWPLLDIKH